MNGNYKNDFYAYNQFNDSWTSAASLPTVSRKGAACFVINNKAYFGTGIDSSNTRLNDWWEYDTMVGINDEMSNSFLEVFPNPSNGNLNITASSLIEEVSVYKMDGSLIVFRQPFIKTFSENFVVPKTGVYLLKVMIDGKTFYEKVIFN